MKKLLQGAVLPFIIFTSGVLLLGCNQPIEQSRQHDDSQIESAQNNHSQNEQSQDLASTDHDQATHKNTADLKQGNMLYIARDVADMQLKTGNYVEKLQQAQTELQQAIESKDHLQLQQTVKDLTRQLQGFNTALISLDLKTQEIDNIRQQVLSANKQVLNSSLLNGDLDISKVDFNKIEKQMDLIQTDMMKLAGMVLLSAGSEQSSNHSEDKS
ncbi:hypothetical protein [Acinetobacter wuhouensis]|uniref:Lipoprotein n=1 Tax=Acinetobacter wuhouensis TaxID=1879050 RepID=A0A4Q7AIY8_9GAMM|nr:hypothetical protein [Acinetobacter wuhouensis]RZG45389.1 hypothetical protein EXU28_12335 [Acinetobacter wuhouensis]